MFTLVLGAVLELVFGKPDRAALDAELGTEAGAELGAMSGIVMKLGPGPGLDTGVGA